MVLNTTPIQMWPGAKKLFRASTMAYLHSRLARHGLFTFRSMESSKTRAHRLKQDHLYTEDVPSNPLKRIHFVGIIRHFYDKLYLDKHIEVRIFANDREILWRTPMEETEEIVSALTASDPVVLALLVALAGIALGAMASWVLLRLNVSRERK